MSRTSDKMHGVVDEVRASLADGLIIRSYSPEDEEAWLRCRALGFLATAYFDDVLRKKPSYDDPAIELVAEIAGSVVGLIDVDITDELATIETIAVHPDFARNGIASGLLREARLLLPRDITTLDAWTRDDEPANRWYLTNGFHEEFRYLHVYATGEREAAGAIVGVRAGLTPVAGFFHADISDEARLRAEFSRVHVCRRYVVVAPD